MKKGSKHTPKAREKIRQANLNRDTTKNLGNFAKKGNVPWNKGVKYDEKMKARLDISGLKTDGFNQKHSEETRKKMLGNKNGRGNKGAIKHGNTGETHWNWQGGISKKSRKERQRFRIELQEKIFRRDNYACQLCLKTGELQIDHIKRWSEYPELRFDMDNCRTLCVDCHYQHTFGHPKPDHVKTWGRNLTQIGG